MLKYVTGDILLTKADALAHGVAPNDHFAQGLALSIRERWPSLYKDFRHYCHTEHPTEGGLWSWKGADSPIIINLLTQEHPHDKSGHPGVAELKHVNHCLKQLVKEIEAHKLKSVAITKLATGVGGLKWPDVKTLLEEHLSSLKIPIFVYETYQKDQAANEI